MAHIDNLYNGLVTKVLDHGFYYSDKSRANMEMLQIPHYTLDIDVTKGFPLITTKKVSWKTVAHELIWLLSGSTSISYLQNNGIKIWDKDAANFDKMHGHYVGRIYGAQWRTWRGRSKGYLKGAENNGDYVYVDQIQNLIQELKTNLHSRRHIVTAWNPAELKDMALPPCHWSFEILPASDYTFELKWHQRSCDVFLGIPFNIGSYAMLGNVIEQETGLKFTRLIGDLSNVHLYGPHIELAREQIKRTPVDQECSLLLDSYTNINTLGIEDFAVVGYNPLAAIKAEMYAKVNKDENS